MVSLACATSALLDLDRSGLLVAAVRAGLGIGVVDILYRRELHDYGGAELAVAGLGVIDAEAQDLAKARALQRFDRGLCTFDGVTLAVAQRRGLMLITQDPVVLRTAATSGVATAAPLTILDELERLGALSHDKLRGILSILITRPSSGVTASEASLRMKRYDKPR